MIALSRPLWLISILALAGCSGDSPETLKKDDAQKPEVTVAEVQVWQDDKTRALPGVVRPGKRVRHGCLELAVTLLLHCRFVRRRN